MKVLHDKFLGLACCPESLEDLKLNLDDPKLSGEKGIQDVVTELAAITGENIRFRRCFTMSKTSLEFFLHIFTLVLNQAEKSGKPKMAIEKMVEGRLRKYYEEVVSTEQKFVVNDTVTVKTLLDNISKEVGSPVKIGSFLRMEVGEGIQQVETDNESEPVAQSA